MASYFYSISLNKFRYKTGLSVVIFNDRAIMITVTINLKCSIIYIFTWNRKLFQARVCDLSKRRLFLVNYEKLLRSNNWKLNSYKNRFHWEFLEIWKNKINWKKNKTFFFLSYFSKSSKIHFENKNLPTVYSFYKLND